MYTILNHCSWPACSDVCTDINCIASYLCLSINTKCSITQQSPSGINTLFNHFCCYRI